MSQPTVHRNSRRRSQNKSPTIPREIRRLENTRINDIDENDMNFFEKFVTMNIKRFLTPRAGRLTDVFEQKKENERLVLYAGRKALELTRRIPAPRKLVPYIPFVTIVTIENYMKYHAAYHLYDIATICYNAEIMFSSLPLMAQISTLKEAGQTSSAVGYTLYFLTHGLKHSADLTVYLSSFVMNMETNHNIKEFVNKGHIAIDKLIEYIHEGNKLSNYKYVNDRHVKNLLRAEEDISQAIENYYANYVMYLIGGLIVFFLVYMVYGAKKRVHQLEIEDETGVVARRSPSKSPSPKRLMFGRRRKSRRKISKRKSRRTRRSRRSRRNKLLFL